MYEQKDENTEKRRNKREKMLPKVSEVKRKSQ